MRRNFRVLSARNAGTGRESTTMELPRSRVHPEPHAERGPMAAPLAGGRLREGITTQAHARDSRVHWSPPHHEKFVSRQPSSDPGAHHGIRVATRHPGEPSSRAPTTMEDAHRRRIRTPERDVLRRTTPVEIVRTDRSSQGETVRADAPPAPTSGTLSGDRRTDRRSDLLLKDRVTRMEKSYGTQTEGRGQG